MIKVGREHPSAMKSGWMLHHRRVMERSLGRPLCENEHVHHKNGVRDDNRIDNLELWSGKDPPGQRMVDLAKEFYRKLIAEGIHVECLHKVKAVFGGLFLGVSS
jgi:hypothetical protein